MVQFYAVVNREEPISPKILDALSWLKNAGDVNEVVLRPLPEAWRGEAGFKKFMHAQERGGMTTRSAWNQEAEALAARAGAASSPAPQTVASSTAAPAGYRFDDCMMVACTTYKNAYLEQAETAWILGYPVQERVRAVNYFYNESTAPQARAFLEKEHISYVMLFAGMQLPFRAGDVPLRLAFGNEAVKIYRFTPTVGL
jgi:hypothetical protein